METKTVTIDHTADLKALREGGRTEPSQWHARLSEGRGESVRLEYLSTLAVSAKKDCRPTVTTIADLQRVIGELSGDTIYITTQKDGFTRIAVPKLREALSRILRLSANTAISSVVIFGDALQKKGTGRKTVARKRGLALRAQREFRTVHEHAREAIALATDLSDELRYWRTRTEECTWGVNSCRAIANKFSDSAAAQSAQTEELFVISQGDCARVEEAYRSAKQHQSRVTRVNTGR